MNKTRLLEIGLGGVVGSLSNIDTESGAPSMGWHGSEARLHHDPTSCDYGVGFYGVSLNAGAYLVEASNGWKCYLCDVIQDDGGGYMSIIPRDPFHTRVYLGSIGLDIEAP